jgi:hypothetical protein
MFSGDIELSPDPAFLCNSVQNNSPTKQLSNVVLEQRLRCYLVVNKILVHFGLHIDLNKKFTNIFKC